jgi:predicted  nucleic acid-binding Zn-ribbon protein
MPTDDAASFLMKEIESIKTTVEKTRDDVVDVRERVTRLEANDEVRLKSLNRIQWGIGIAVTSVIGGIPVLFLIWDRLTN